MWVKTLSACLIWLGLTFAFGAAATLTGPVWSFKRSEFRITVRVPTGEDAAKGTYEITVADELNLLNRLSAPREGVLRDAWVTDLNENGRFDVVVALQSADPGAHGSVSVYEWQGMYFTPLKIAPMPPLQDKGYAGHDEFALVGKRLQRTFPVHEPADAEGTVRGRIRTLRYSFAAAEWVLSGDE